jgi:hypothetical protein
MIKLAINVLALALAILLMSAVAVFQGAPTTTVADAGDHFFQETGHNVPAIFYQYWQTHGGLAQQGYPITDAKMEKNSVDGKQYLTQYFERARFEQHPEYKGTPNEVLLGLLGVEVLKCSPSGATGTANAKDAPTTSDFKFLARPENSYISEWCVQDYCGYRVPSPMGLQNSEMYATQTVSYHRVDEKEFDPQQLLNFYTNQLLKDGWTIIKPQSTDPSAGLYFSSVFAPPASLKDKVKRFGFFIGHNIQQVDFAVIRAADVPKPPTAPDLSLFVGH